MRVLAALVALLGTLLLAPGAEASAPAGVPRTYDAALARFDGATEVRALGKFVTPSGNIFCSLGKRTVKGCELGEGAIKDPAVCAGNPVSSYVSFEVFVLPAIRRLMGRPPYRRPTVEAVCAHGFSSVPGREQYVRARFEAAGVEAERPVVATCGSGVTACILSLGLVRAGFPEAAVYDGSWTEWASRPETPKATG